MHSFLDISIAIMALAGSGFACNVVNSVKLTNYGYPDASGVPSYACSNGAPVQPGTSTKLGDGSFGNPYAAAAAVTSTVFKKCAKVYVPLLEKYFIIQDDCGGCHATPDTWIDLYLIQSNKDIGQSSCEASFGTLSYNANAGAYQHEVLVSPASGLLTNTQSLFQSGTCYNKASQGRVFPARDSGIKCPAAARKREVLSGSSSTDASYMDTPPLDTTPGDSNDTSVNPAGNKVVPEAADAIRDESAAHSGTLRMRFARKYLNVHRRGHGMISWANKGSVE